jgi:hypothetical protein
MVDLSIAMLVYQRVMVGYITITESPVPNCRISVGSGLGNELALPKAGFPWVSVKVPLYRLSPMASELCC